MSSCDSSNCGCGSSCSCGSSCNCNSYSIENTITETVVLGVAPVKSHFEGAETSAENGCKCGSNCTCDPCNCK
ncbi:hypothetical protein VNO78_25855 [Psophocarpus tetragonolobus]|uniref:Metallothionein-like protein n=1 Tax=Psophocarpus tetragonolobus TaxID=3891 RepID=A0AAN9S7V9_PSOTE